MAAKLVDHENGGDTVDGPIFDVTSIIKMLSCLGFNRLQNNVAGFFI